MRFLLKSVHYASLSRTDLFTLPCSRAVRFARPLDPSRTKHHHPLPYMEQCEKRMAICNASYGRNHPTAACRSWSGTSSR